MVSYYEVRVINGHRFRDVTNETVASQIFNHEEADAYAHGHSIATTGSRITPRAADAPPKKRVKNKRSSGSRR